LRFAAGRQLRFESFFNGLKGTGDNHFSLVSAILAGADLLECFLASCYGHFRLPPIYLK
jgi:hypothetical protein